MDTWWIEQPWLLGSANPSTSDLDSLSQDGFTVLVSLLQEPKESPDYDMVHAESLGFARHNIPVEDYHPPTVSQLTDFVNLVERLPRDSRVVVHCEGGRGRTGTFAAAYWITKGMTVLAAIARVRLARWGAVETPEQEAVLNDFARGRDEAGPAASD